MASQTAKLDRIGVPRRLLRSLRSRRLLLAVAAVVLIPVLTLAAGCVWLWAEDAGTISPAAHGNGSDAMWMGTPGSTAGVRNPMSTDWPPASAKPGFVICSSTRDRCRMTDRWIRC